MNPYESFTDHELDRAIDSLNGVVRTSDDDEEVMGALCALDSALEVWCLRHDREVECV
jgi:hypothetical protein